jgi:uncharacterized protein
MLTDLVQIRLLGEKKREENLRFRRHMKAHDHSDRILRRIGEGIEEQIDCTQCANCCKVATTTVSGRDVERLARHLRLPREKFLADYTTVSEDEPQNGGRILRRTAGGCIFLDGTRCSVYEFRPETCQRFPHIVRGQGSMASRMWQFVDRACYCPIVYHSLEAFKQELGFRR